MFKVEDVIRDPAISVVTRDDKGRKIFSIPDVSEVKEYGQKNNLDYSIPRYINKTHFYICMRYRVKKTGVRWITMINPLVLSTEGMVFVEETQHGVEGIYLVPRHPRILIAYTEGGTLNPIQRELVGLAALQFQQALQATNGLFISDIGLRVDDYPEYMEADDEGKQKIADNYFKALNESFKEVVEENKEVKDYLKATEFLAEKIEMANATEGVMPPEVQKVLDEEAEKAEAEVEVNPKKKK